MGRLVVTEFMTLDGVGQAPGQPDEDRDGDFPHGGWQAPVADEESGRVIFDQASSMSALLLGRRTYEIFADYWPNAPADIPFTRLLNDVPKFVVSTTLADPLAWAGSTLLSGDLAHEIGALKDRYAEVHVIGSLDLVQHLLRIGAVDRLHLWVYPLLLGTGKKVFTDGTLPAALRLIGSTAYPKGGLHLVYETAGAPSYGDMSAGA